MAFTVKSGAPSVTSSPRRDLGLRSPVWCPPKRGHSQVTPAARADRAERDADVPQPRRSSGQDALDSCGRARGEVEVVPTCREARPARCAGQVSRCPACASGRPGRPDARYAVGESTAPRAGLEIDLTQENERIRPVSDMRGRSGDGLDRGPLRSMPCHLVRRPPHPIRAPEPRRSPGGRVDETSAVACAGTPIRPCGR